ncbi:MAG: type 4a pilus biogenesis protein PilO [Candidatus Omnitrophica bacterium]|nr:type 4a pilus biogenesis protein PilO [Candidatus Omnitrophota bacterium]
MEMTKERLAAVVSASLVIFGLGLYLFLYRPLKLKLRDARVQAAAVEKDLARMHRAIGYLKKNPVRRAIITEDGVSLAMDELTQEAKLKGINFISITPAQPIESRTGGYKILPIDIEAESTYADFGIFLGALDEFKNSVVTVEGFSLYSYGDDPANLRSRLTLGIYLSE